MEDQGVLVTRRGRQRAVLVVNRYDGSVNKYNGDRMEYTVIGDTANVASRLTSNDIARRDQVVCSGATLAELGDDVSVIDLGVIAVRGRAEPVSCHQVDRIGAIASPNPAPPPERPSLAAAVAGSR